MLDRSKRPVALVAEDDPDFREAVATVLSREGMEVVLASTGREAVVRALEAKPDVVLLDHRMPEMSGLDALRLLRMRGFAGAVIHMSGFDFVDFSERGDHFVLSKPFGVASLLFAVRRALSRAGKQPWAQA